MTVLQRMINTESAVIMILDSADPAALNRVNSAFVCEWLELSFLSSPAGMGWLWKITLPSGRVWICREKLKDIK